MKNSKKIPKIFTTHLIKEFTKSLLLFVLIILSLIIVTTYIEELFFFRDYNKKNIYLLPLFITLIKSPAILINLFPFVFLFSSIHFFVNLIKNKEFSSLRISGFSNTYIIFVPSIFSFLIATLIVLLLSPVSSELMKYHEKIKKNISGNNNLVIVNDNGIWIKEEKNNKITILKSNSFVQKNSAALLNNLSIFFHDENGQLIKNIISEKAVVKNNIWLLENVEEFNNDQKKKFYKLFKFKTTINLEELNNIFSNADTFSVWNILNYLDTLKSRGYSSDELKIKLHKYLSFPLLIFSTIILGSVFTINSKRTHENYTYIFFGIASGISVYFLSDLSIALGKSERLPLYLSVWLPVILILILSLFSLIRRDEE